MLITENERFVNPQEAFLKCFDTDEERSEFMYMYSKGDTHYFKNIDRRYYITKTVKGLESHMF